MKKQKFLPYQEPIFKKPMLPSRGQNMSSISTKNKRIYNKNARSLHKIPQQIIKKNQIYDQVKQRVRIQQELQSHQISAKLFHINVPKQMFLNKGFTSNNQHNSLRKITNQFQNENKLAQSQGKRTISSTKQSHKKINNSALLPKKDLKQLKLKNWTDSPYLKNLSDVSKLVKMLKPVKGPNQSIKKQIVQYNDLNKKNHELVVLRRPNQTFQAKRQVYLERIGLKPNSKVFVMNSRDRHIKQTLIQRGWIELDDISDSFYHLKWVYSDSSNDYSNINRGQLFNHFYNNQELTNKNNLRKNIKATILQNRPEIPLTYDFGIAQQYKKFIQNATLLEGIKHLHMIKNTIQIYEPKLYRRITSNPNHFKYHNKSKNIFLKKYQQTQISQDLRDYLFSSDQDSQMLIHNTIQLISFLVYQLQKQTYLQYSLFYYQQKGKFKNILPIFEYFNQLLIQKQSLKLINKLPKFLKVQIIKIYFHFTNNKTFYKKSYGISNSWIIKPTGVARGTGIYIQSDYKKLMSQTNNQHGKIIQKYIQRPFLLSDKRKIDLRQWVLVKNFQPLEAYIFPKLYGRICPQVYSYGDFQNIQKHLTNYSLSKEIYKTKNNSLPYILQNQQNSILFSCIGIRKIPSASIILEQDLQRQIKRSKNKSKKWNEIKLEIKQNIIKTLKACSGGIVQNSNCFEVYGFDILLDEDLNVFIIQVNLSPACEQRQGLEVYLKDMSNGLIDMVQDWLNINEKEYKTKSEDTQKQQTKIWQKLDEQKINQQREKMNKQKIQQQKAILIQNWIKKLINKNK